MKNDGTIDVTKWERRKYWETLAFGNAAKHALGDLREKYGSGGESPNLARRRLLTGLAKIYRSAGGTVTANRSKATGEYTSPFVRWVHALLELTPKAETISQIGSAIERLHRDKEFMEALRSA
jgi:hypothetical protein